MKKEEKVILDVIKKFGDVINLRETPHVLFEIFRQFGGIIVAEIPDAGPPPPPPPPPPLPGGVPPTAPEPPPPSPEPSQFGKFKGEDIMREILKLSKEIVLLRKDIATLKK